MSDALLQIETALSTSSPFDADPPALPRKDLPSLTVFPNAFPDDPDPGIFPALITRVKQTFASSPVPSAPRAEHAVDGAPLLAVPGQTEAQGIVEATKRAQAASAQAIGSSHLTKSAPGSPSGPTSPIKTTSLKPPSTSSKPSSVASRQSSTTRRLVPVDRQWRPSAPTAPQVALTTVNSVVMPPTAAVDPLAQAMPPPRSTSRLRIRDREPDLQHQMYARAHPGTGAGPSRSRRESIATLPDSPSLYSLSAMVAANTRLTGATYSPGFNEDARSVKEVGLSKRVQQYMRKMRGEGLSKDYWMADEQCKECYQCHTVGKIKHARTHRTVLHDMETTASLSDMRSDILQSMRFQYRRCQTIWPGRRDTDVRSVQEQSGRISRPRR